jgi:predicted ATP-grasp superfamily ATP-dependent carboligase
VTHVLIAGTSTRAAADSAARAGFRVTAVDAYADLDQHPAVRALSMPRDFGQDATARAMARASRTIDCGAVSYLSPFENHPRAVSTLAAGRALWGNAPDELRRVRDPWQLAAGLHKHGFAMPAMRSKGGPNDPNDPNDWLIKPFRSGGGHHVRRWQGEPVPRLCWLQERIAGCPGSVVFAAAGGRAVPLGVSRQLIGDPAFGSSGFRYCGSIIAAADDAQFAGGSAIVERACALAAAAASEFGLGGVNGIDFVASGGELFPIEMNPRWSSSMELVEQLFGVSVFGAHAAAFEAGMLPRFDLMAAMRQVNAVGKAIVFARGNLVLGDTRRWLGDPAVRDVPHPQERIRAGQPICTVFATARDGQRCYDALVARAERLYADLAG